MIVGAAFLLAATLTATQAHRPLGRMVRGNWDPRVGITCWLSALIGVVATGAVAVFMLSHAGHGGFETILNELRRCWAAVGHASAPISERLATVIGAGLMVYLGSRLGVGTVRQIRRRRHRSDLMQSLLWMAAAPDAGNVRWLDHPEPLAFSVAGRPGLIAATSGLADVLSPAGLRATLAPEQAHLNGRHHLLVDVAEAAATAFPWAPLFRAAPAAMRELVELAADNAAAARHGAHHVADALRTVAAARAPEGGLAMADTAVTRRIARLHSTRPQRLHALRHVWCAAAALTIPLVPTLFSAALLLIVGCA